MSVGGSVEGVSVAGREFSVATDADTQRKLGGFENDVEANGDGSARIIKTRVPFKLDGLVLNVDDDNGDHEFLQDLANSNRFFTLSITYVSGATYQGTAQLTGELQFSSQKTTATVGFMGPSALVKQ
jgi:hypothetical protein